MGRWADERVMRSSSMPVQRRAWKNLRSWTSAKRSSEKFATEMATWHTKILHMANVLPLLREVWCSCYMTKRAPRKGVGATERRWGLITSPGELHPLREGMGRMDHR